MVKKTIILVRHGQYSAETEISSEKLTPLGRRQAQRVARRLRDFNISRMVHSTMPRAVETADIIRKHLRYRKSFKACDELRECLPTIPTGMPGKFKQRSKRETASDRRQAERAFRKYFSAHPAKSSVEVLVCHGNIIRYLICRVLDVEVHKWPQLDIHQCGISIVEVRSKGPRRRTIISHNDIGHIPLRMRTFI